MPEKKSCANLLESKEKTAYYRKSPKYIPKHFSCTIDDIENICPPSTAWNTGYLVIYFKDHFEFKKANSRIWSMDIFDCLKNQSRQFCLHKSRVYWYMERIK